MNVSAGQTRFFATRDATLAVLGSAAVGYVLVRMHGEPAILNLAAMGVPLLLVAAAAASILLRRPAFSTVADRVTLVRAVLAGACATLVMFTLFGSVAPRSWLLVSLATPALLLDAVDGWVARRTGTANAHGARFDMETDAAFLMVLSIPLAWVVGPWVLAIGAMRYVFWAATWFRPALRQELSFSQFRRVTAGIQCVVLVLALMPIVPSPLATLITALALALLTLSFGRDVVSLERSFTSQSVRTAHDPASHTAQGNHHPCSAKGQKL